MAQYTSTYTVQDWTVDTTQYIVTSYNPHSFRQYIDTIDCLESNKLSDIQQQHLQCFSGNIELREM